MELKIDQQTIMIADGKTDANKQSYFIDGITLPEKVTITNNFNDNAVVGEATVTKDGDKLVASMVITNKSIIKKLLNGASYYPATGMLLTGDFDKDNTPEQKMELFTVGLGHTPNADERIKPISITDHG